jgi:hypothetical protein
MMECLPDPPAVIAVGWAVNREPDTADGSYMFATVDDAPPIMIKNFPFCKGIA